MSAKLAAMISRFHSTNLHDRCTDHETGQPLALHGFENGKVRRVGIAR
jgi:hypothetical protein